MLGSPLESGPLSLLSLTYARQSLEQKLTKLDTLAPLNRNMLDKALKHIKLDTLAPLSRNMLDRAL